MQCMSGWEEWKFIPLEEPDFERLRKVLETRCHCAVSVSAGIHGINLTMKGENCVVYLRSEWDRLAIGNIGFEERRAGIGTAVIDWLKKYVCAKGFRSLVAIGVWEDAQGFYAKNGFVETGLTEWSWAVPSERC